MWNAKFAKTMIIPLGLVLAACGGGGGGSAPTTVAHNTPPATTPTNSDTSNDTTDSTSETYPEKPYAVPTGCVDFYEPKFKMTEGKDETQPAKGFAKPVKGNAYTDPAYTTCVVRATDHESEGLLGFARNDYSRRQPFNADETRMLVYSQGSAWHTYDVESLEKDKRLALSGRIEPQWHPTDPDLLYFMANEGGMTISTYNIKTDEKKVVADFRKLDSIANHPGATSLTDIWPSAARAWTRNEGAPSADGRYWALQVETSSFAPLGLITYDMQTNTIKGVYDFKTDGGGVGRPDHVSISPSGDHVVPSWTGAGECSANTLGTVNKPCGMIAFSSDFSTAVGLAPRSPHSDLGTDADGRDIVVASNYDTGWVEMWDLATGVNTKLWQIYENNNGTAMHVSARNIDKPGWVLISTYMEKKPGWYASKLMAVETKAAPRILNIAHTYNKVETYFSETHATVNRDFTKIVFNSNWQTANMLNIDTYIVSLPKDAVPQS